MKRVADPLMDKDEAAFIFETQRRLMDRGYLIIYGEKLSSVRLTADLFNQMLGWYSEAVAEGYNWLEGLHRLKTPEIMQACMGFAEWIREKGYLPDLDEAELHGIVVTYTLEGRESLRQSTIRSHVLRRMAK